MINSLYTGEKMKVKIKNNSFSDEWELTKLNVFVGSNLSGKSGILNCIYLSADANKRYSFIGYSIPLGQCEIEDASFDYAIYVDVHMATDIIYEGTDSLSFLNDIRNLVTDEEINESRTVIEKLLTELREKLTSLNLEDEADYLEPLRVFPTKNELVWKDFTGTSEKGVYHLSMAFYNALIVTLMQYVYALSKKYKVLLILDEPETFAHPSFAFFLGKLINTLTLQSNNLTTICATHSWDFLQGIKNGAKVKVIKRKKDGKVEVNDWNGEVYIPGFGVTGMLSD